MLGIAELLIIGLSVEWLFKKIKLPGFLGILLVGVILSSYISNHFFFISEDIRTLALIIILLRAGLSVHLNALKQIQKQFILLSFLPGIFEAITITLLAPLISPLNSLEAAMLGFILAAVSPAVVVPMMIDIQNQKLGIKKGIPTLVLASASIDDIIAIVIFSILLNCYIEGFSLVVNFAQLPTLFLSSIAVGIFLSYLFSKLLNLFKVRSTILTLLLLSLSMILIHLEGVLLKIDFLFSGLLSIVTIGFYLLKSNQLTALKISKKLSKLWVFASVILFVYIGSQLDFNIAKQASWSGILLILAGLLMRSLVVIFCLHGSFFTWSEKKFIIVSFWPKATVQAALGAVPLIAMEQLGMITLSGHWILSIAVMSIIVTAPLGAIMISYTSGKYLVKS